MGSAHAVASHHLPPAELGNLRVLLSHQPGHAVLGLPSVRACRAVSPVSGVRSRRAQVVIVGGGPAGAASAYFLARAGVDVMILDRARFPRDKPCSEYMSPQASRILNDMGLLSRVEN